MEIDRCDVAAGLAALTRGDWVAARAEFERALAREESPEAHEGLAAAAEWLEDLETTFDSRRRAYRLFRAAGDGNGAARLATSMAWDAFLAGDEAVCRGLARRAWRLLEGQEASPEAAQLLIFEAHRALFAEHDPVLAEDAAGQAMALARDLGIGDLEMYALAYRGLALVDQGRVTEGLSMVDEAAVAAVAGEIQDPIASASCCCTMIFACERVRDYPRAAQWCQRLQQVSETLSFHLMRSKCRTHYAGVLTWRGLWEEAECELLTAIERLGVTRPGEAAEAVVRLGELRCRQGRFEEAAAAFARTETGPLHLLGATIALRGRAELALQLGDPTSGAELAGRYLRGLGAENRLQRIGGLELLARARAATGELERAGAAVAELSALAAEAGTESLFGSACAARAAVEGARGHREAARLAWEDAVDHFRRSGGMYAEASARVQLAETLAETGRPAAAVAETQAAYRVLHAMGAADAANRAAGLLRRLGAAMAESVDLDTSEHLTPRETEILRFVARGLSNQQIAGELVLSVRTVERHIGNVYQKLGVEGSTARSEATAFALTRGLS